MCGSHVKQGLMLVPSRRVRQRVALKESSGWAGSARLGAPSPGPAMVVIDRKDLN